MNLYKGLVKLDKDNKIEDIVVIDEGFSWVALIFNPIWFLFHKMWLEFFLFLSILILFNWTSRFGIYDFFMQASLIFMMALNSKSWYFDALIKRKKYCFMAMVFGMNATEAKIKFINQINLQNKENNEKIIFSDNLLNPKYFK
jgi:hypothetical protein